MEWISWIGDPNTWVSLVTLTFLEIVLGIDNVIFISILAGKLPPNQRVKARTIGLGLALVRCIVDFLSGILLSLLGVCKKIEISAA